MLIFRALPGVLLLAACSGSTFSIDQATTLDDSSIQASESADPDSSGTDAYALLLDIDATYPVDASAFNLSSPFGPRLKASDNDRYDFHRGIDIPGSEGDPVYAITDGVIYAAYPAGSNAYADGGNVVVVKHTLTSTIEFHDTSVTTFYTVYLHLSSLGTAAQQYITDGTKIAVSKGENIGSMGSSGDTDFTHLHFEVRLATPCSLEYQLANTDSTCSGYGFDPHINPLAMYASTIDDDASIEFVSGSDTQVTVRATTPESALIVDGAKLEVYDSAEKTTLLYKKILSFNLREGFDATSTATLDEESVTGATISPASFTSTSDAYQIDFTFDLDEQLWENRHQIYIDATLITIFGEATQIHGSLTRDN